MECARSRTQVFKATEGEPIIIRRAKAIRRHCETQKKPFREEIEPYWRGKTIAEHWRVRVPAETFAIAFKTGIIDADLKNEGGPGEIAMAYQEMLLPRGYGGLKAEARARLEAADLTPAENLRKAWFWQAMIIVCEAMEILARRHARTARELAGREQDPIHRQELEGMAGVCDWVATNQPRSFHEALQLIWFTQIALYMEANAPSYSPGRMDQYLFPFLSCRL